MAHRTPARWLAPAALVTAAVAVWVIVGSGTGSDDEPDDTPATEQRSGQRTSSRTTTAERTTTTARRRTRTYTVKAGDTPSSIAEANGITLDALLAANPDLDAQTLNIGDRLRLPAQ